MKSICLPLITLAATLAFATHDWAGASSHGSSDGASQLDARASSMSSFAEQTNGQAAAVVVASEEAATNVQTSPKGPARSVKRPPRSWMRSSS